MRRSLILIVAPRALRPIYGTGAFHTPIICMLGTTALTGPPTAWRQIPCPALGVLAVLHIIFIFTWAVNRHRWIERQYLFLFPPSVRPQRSSWQPAFAAVAMDFRSTCRAYLHGGIRNAGGLVLAVHDRRRRYHRQPHHIPVSPLCSETKASSLRLMLIYTIIIYRVFRGKVGTTTGPVATT
jgi:hypothetical protein